MANPSNCKAKPYRTLFDIINPSLPKPDLTLYLYSPIDKLLKNVKARGRKYEQNITAEYLEKLQNSYLDYFKLQTQARIVLLNTANLNYADFKHDYEFIVEVLNTEFEMGLHYV